MASSVEPPAQAVGAARMIGRRYRWCSGCVAAAVAADVQFSKSAFNYPFWFISGSLTATPKSSCSQSKGPYGPVALFR